MFAVSAVMDDEMITPWIAGSVDSDGNHHHEVVQEAPWVSQVPKQELIDLHHGLRLVAEHPGLSVAERDAFVALADTCWEEIGEHWYEGQPPAQETAEQSPPESDFQGVEG